ncbi:rho GTPase-activating protein 12-like [Sarcoptes scabiei]|nr:rho GTPase-activating protein 12-like [Sarcoptes scabiei]
MILEKLEKHWNWIDIYYDRCLVPLGTYQDQPSTIKFQNWHQKMESVCDFCSEVQQIVQLNRLNHSAAFDRDEEFLDRLTFLIANKIPFLVQNDSYFRDEINRWPIRKEFSTVKLLQKVR